MRLKKLFLIKSDQEVTTGMVRVLLALQKIEADVTEVRLEKRDGQIVIVRKGGR